MLIYRLTFASGKVYIGQTTGKTVKSRLKGHRDKVGAGSMFAVHCAWRKHGEPSVDILATASNQEELDEMEVAQIAQHNSLSPHGYNLMVGGLGGGPRTESTRAKIAAAKIGHKPSDETRAMIGSGSKANWQDPDYRQKQAEGIAKSFTPERRAMLSEHAKRIHTGRVVSEEARAKMSARTYSPETRAKMSAAAKARKRAPWSEETKAKMAASAAASWSNQDHRERRTAAIRQAVRQEVVA